MNKTTTMPKTDAEIEAEFGTWLEKNSANFTKLKSRVIELVSGFISENDIDVLSISGRIKENIKILEKIKRKAYSNPKHQMTDIVGIRIIAFLESDVQKISDIIRRSFEVDEKNSSNTDDRMSANEVGYRSVHFVCDLGEERCKLAEYSQLKNLKFEFQIRTVLQHAWAELSHDRDYKFSGTLPRHLQRRLYLMAGLLETADRGFDDLSRDLDGYIASISAESAEGNLDIEINSISLDNFINKWASENAFVLRGSSDGPDSSKLVATLAEYGVTTLAQLNDIIPRDYADKARHLSDNDTLGALVFRWMIIHDSKRFLGKVSTTWSPSLATQAIMRQYFAPQKVEAIRRQLLSKRYGSKLRKFSVAPKRTAVRRS